MAKESHLVHWYTQQAITDYRCRAYIHTFIIKYPFTYASADDKFGLEEDVYSYCRQQFSPVFGRLLTTQRMHSVMVIQVRNIRMKTCLCQGRSSLTVRPLYRTGVSLLSRERFIYI